jgi:hypothetical protein
VGGSGGLCGCGGFCGGEVGAIMADKGRIDGIGSEPPRRCSKCMYGLDETGWCNRCAESRAMGLSFLTAVVSAVLGFGACVFGIDSGVNVVWANFGLVLFWGSPVVWIVMYYILKRRPS